MKPGIDYFVNRSQNKSFDQTDVKVLTNTAFLLAGFNNFRNEVLIHLGHLPNLFFRQTAALMGLNLIHHRHVAVPLKFHEVPPDKVAQFVQTVVSLIDGSAESIKNLLGPVVEKLHQNIVFVFEIKINGAVCHAGLSSDLSNRRLVKALAGKDFYGRFQDEMIFIVFFFSVDFGPPVSETRSCKMNECSFIIPGGMVPVKSYFQPIKKFN